MSLTCPNCGSPIADESSRACPNCGNILPATGFTTELPEAGSRAKRDDSPPDRTVGDPNIVNPLAASPNNAVAAIVIFSILLCGSQGASIHGSWPSKAAFQSSEAGFGYVIGLFLGLALAWDYTRWINRAVSITGLDAAQAERATPPSEAISYLMLSVTLISGIVMFLGKSIGLTEMHIAWIGSAAVLATAIMAYFNMKPMTMRNPRDMPQSAFNGPVFAYLGLLGFWLICFPGHFVIRSRLGAKNLIVPALIATVVYVAHIAQPLLVEPELPSADDAEVVSMLRMILEDEPMMKPVTVAQPIETSFNVEQQIRMGQCTIKSKFGEEKTPYRIDWQDRKKGVWRVQVMDRLPLVNMPEVLDLVRKILEDDWVGNAKRRDLGPLHVEQAVQTGYDAVRQLRTGTAMVRTDKGFAPVTIFVEWDPRGRKLPLIRVLGNPP